jgi:Holliday junction resolvase RusA-like endonuclease
MTTALTGATLLVHLIVPGEPCPKARPRLAPKGHTYTPRRTTEHEAKVLAYLKVQYPRLVPVEGALSVSCDFYLSTARTVDIDNLLKLPLDSMNRVVWKDDSQIVEVYARKHLSGIPRTEISVYVLGGTGAA